MGIIQWAAILISAFLIGITKTGLPGVGILAVTLMAGAMPAKESTGFILPLLIVGDVFAVTYYRRHAVWRHLVVLIPWALAGVFLGYLAMGRIDSEQLRPIIGVIVLVVLGSNCLWRRKSDSAAIPTHWSFAATAGIAAGVTTMMANAAGPIMIVYLLAMRLPKEEFIGTGAWYFLIVNCIKIPFSYDLGLITAESLTRNAILAPAVLLGAALGVVILKRLPDKMFVFLVQILTVAAAVKLLF